MNTYMYISIAVIYIHVASYNVFTYNIKETSPQIYLLRSFVALLLFPNHQVFDQTFYFKSHVKQL